MYKHILIPTDGSATAAKAVEAGIEYARETKAKVTLFTAVPEYQPPGEVDVLSRHFVSLEEHGRHSMEAAKERFAAAAEQARTAGVEFDTDYAQSDRPYEAIVEAAKRHGCDAIFMSSHGRTGLARLWHGSQAADVITHSSIPTMVYR